MAMFSAKIMSPEKFEPFSVHTTSYKNVGDHAIGVDIIIPKNLSSTGSRGSPLMVRFHGGFLVAGSSMLPMFFTNWILDLAKTNSAVIVSADYRLLPEGNGFDILEDINDLWKWIYNGSLQTCLDKTLGPSAPRLDLQHVLTVGESSGGYLAIQSALTQPKDSMKLVLGLYPQLDVGSKFYNTTFNKPIFGMPMLPSQLIDDHLSTSPRGTVVSTAYYPARIDVACSIAQNGRLLEFLGSDEVLLPLEAVKIAKNLPAVCIIHGTEDTVVPVDGSKVFVESAKLAHPHVPIRLDLQPGEHAFDGEAELCANWLKLSLEFIEQHWLK